MQFINFIICHTNCEKKMLCRIFIGQIEKSHVALDVYKDHA